MTEKYTGSIDISFDGMPLIQLEAYRGDEESNVWERLSNVTRQRRFTLQQDWVVELGDIAYEADLNGKIVIPAKDENSKYNIFDGASIPVPWLISLLTIGILRPLGVALIGSIIHDYAYSNGILNVLVEGKGTRQVRLERHTADKLFRDIIGTVNRLPIVGYVAWLAVRVGWLWVPYNGKRYTGKVPYIEYIFIALMVALLYTVESVLDLLIQQRWLLLIFGSLYILSYFASIFLQWRFARRE